MSESKVPAITAATATAATTTKNKRKRRGSGEETSVASEAVTSVASAAATSTASTAAAAAGAAAGAAAASGSSATANVSSSGQQDDLAKYFDQFQGKPTGTRNEWEKLVEASHRFEEFLESKISEKEEREKLKSSPEERDSNQPLTEGSNDDDDDEAVVDLETNEDWNQLVDGCKRLGVDSLDFDKVTGTERSNLKEVHSSFRLSIMKGLEKTYKKIQETKEELKAYAKRSNKTETAGSRKSQIDPANFAELMQGVHIQSPSKAEQKVDNQVTKGGDRLTVDPWWTAKTPKGDTLQRFSNFWNELVRLSTKFSSSDYHGKGQKTIKKEVLNTINKIIDWDNGSTKSNCRDGRTNYVKFHFPECTALEKEGVQPLIAALQHALCRIDPVEDDEGEQTGKAPSSTRFEQRRERYMPGTKNRTKRYIDIESLPPNAFNPYLLDHEMKLVEEIKNVCRKSIRAEALHKEVTFQILSPLGKRCLVAFDVADVGIDVDSVGLIITPVYVQVVRLGLQNMGTDDVRVVFDRTAMFPLVHRDAFEEFVKYKEDRPFLEDQLYPSTDTNSSSDAQPGVVADLNNDGDREPPKGLTILWQLMHCSDEDLGVLFFHGAEKKQEATYIADAPTEEGAETRQSIDQYIGSGSQGIVYGLADDKIKKFVVKSSVVGETRYIKREIEALQRLSVEGEAEAKYVTKLESFGRVEYNIRSSIAKVPALLISPRGQPADSYLASQPAERTKLLLLLWSNGQSALAYARQKGVFHLDVCPRNFIFCDQTKVFVLIDWGCSFCEDDPNNRPIGFRGSLLFAHAEVHNRPNTFSWSPKDSYDKASLLFTIRALQKGSSNPFKGFDRRIEQGKDKECKSSSDSPFKERRDTTLESLKDLLDSREGTTEGLAIQLYGLDVGTVNKTKKEKEKVASKIMNAAKECLANA